MVTIGPTRWFVRASRTPERGGWARYRLSMIPEARRYRIMKVEYHGLDERTVEAVVPAPEIVIASRIDSWASGNDEARLVRSLCEEMSAQAVGEAIRLQLVHSDGVEKRARQLIVRDALLKSAQRGDEAVEVVDEVDLRDYYLEIFERRAEEARIEAERAARIEAERAEEWRVRAAEDAIARTHETSSRKRSMALLYENLPPEMVKEAKEKRTITVNSGGDAFVVPIKPHGLVARYNGAGEYVASYCIMFGPCGMPLGDEVLMKVVLIRSDLPYFLKKANKFIRRPDRR